MSNVIWGGKYKVLDEEHIKDLEMSAAINEFSHKMPRHEAEELAYNKYKKERILDSAAHHLQGIRTAIGAGDRHAAAQHGTMYTMIMSKLGMSPTEAPPPEIEDRIKDSPSSMYAFNAHSADELVSPQGGGGEDMGGGEGVEKSEDDTLAPLMSKIKDLLCK